MSTARAGQGANAAPLDSAAAHAGSAAGTLRVFIDGVAFWSPALPGWPIARAAFRGEGDPVDPPAKRPAPEILAPAERRRAPDSVALALEVASAAVRESGREAANLPSVFTSAQGDLAVNDYMCTTLASQPLLISPTRFHNSVHNAAAGYWTIGTGCMAASTALTAFEQSFAAGLLEAATQCVADATPVVLVAFDVQATGALASVTKSEGLLAAAFVLACEPSERTQAAFDISLVNISGAALPLRSAAARSLQHNGMADMLPFAEALALGSADALELPLSRSLALRLVHRAPTPA
ncbi:MAG: beta-ketoacyl synthase chain length factor [Pseudomonadota bacterium]|nr:beta-ketoacyl synthase chain length factor [Pseudomonadota bacterium]